MIKVAVMVVFSQYVRSKTDDTNLNSQCLWWKDGSVIELHQNADGDPSVSGDTEFAAVGRSIATWQTEMNACGSLTLRDASRSMSKTVGYVASGPNENLIVFRLKKCTDAFTATAPCWASSTCGNQGDCWDHSNSAIAITSTSYTPSTGRDLDSDIELNSPSFQFTTGVPVITDVENTMTHELGHLVGLAHINLFGSTMNPRAETGEIGKRVLDPGSKQFVCDVYPKGKPVRTCQIPVLSSTLGAKAPGCSSVSGDVMVLWSAIALAVRGSRSKRAVRSST